MGERGTESEGVRRPGTENVGERGTGNVGVSEGECGRERDRECGRGTENVGGSERIGVRRALKDRVYLVCEVTVILSIPVAALLSYFLAPILS